MAVNLLLWNRYFSLLFSGKIVACVISEDYTSVKSVKNVFIKWVKT